LTVLKHHGNCGRCALDLSFKQADDARISGVISSRVVGRADRQMIGSARGRLGAVLSIPDVTNPLILRTDSHVRLAFTRRKVAPNCRLAFRLRRRPEKHLSRLTVDHPPCSMMADSATEKTATPRRIAMAAMPGGVTMTAQNSL
jgi:hypothetical protein